MCYLQCIDKNQVNIGVKQRVLQLIYYNITNENVLLNSMIIVH